MDATVSGGGFASIVASPSTPKEIARGDLMAFSDPPRRMKYEFSSDRCVIAMRPSAVIDAPEISSSAEMTVGWNDGQASKKSRKTQSRFQEWEMDVLRDSRVNVAVCESRSGSGRIGFRGRKLKRG